MGKVKRGRAPKAGKGPTEKGKAPKAKGPDNYNCFYAGKEYSNGALLCQAGELFQCSYGVWVDQGKSCKGG